MALASVLEIIHFAPTFSQARLFSVVSTLTVQYLLSQASQRGGRTTFTVLIVACVAGVKRGRGNLGAREKGKDRTPAKTPLFSPIFTLRFRA